MPIVPSRRQTSSNAPVEDRWRTLAGPTAKSPSMEQLMRLRGLGHVKAIALSLYTQVGASQATPSN